MYTLSATIPNELLYLKQNKKVTGILVFIAGVVYEIFSLFLLYFIFINLPNSDTEFFLSFVFIQQLPFSIILFSLGGLLLLYSIQLLFYVEGWKISNDRTSSIAGVSKFSKLLFIKFEIFIRLENIRDFIVHTMYFDEHKLVKRKRLEIEYYNEKLHKNESFILFYNKNEELEYEITRIINFSRKILEKEISIKETFSQV